MEAKVLLIYPALYRTTGLHVGIGSLSAALKESGHEVRVFDTAFYKDAAEDKGDQIKIRAERGISKEIRTEDEFMPPNTTDMQEDLIGLITEYSPDLIGISVLETVYDLSLQISRLIKRHFPEMPVIAGGVMPSLVPDAFIGESSIDMVCIGEGETPLIELCKRLSENMALDDIDGLWIKNAGKITKKKPCTLQNINEIPYPDYSEFDNRLFYKPMQGRIYKMVSIESSRGCFFECSYCAAPQLRVLFKDNDCGQYSRNMDMEKIIGQIHFQIELHNPEFIYFSSESFLSMSETEFDHFIREYAEIGLPFWIQTRIETLSKKRLEELRRVGLHWLSIGLEHGNDDFRRRILKRKYSNTKFIEKMSILKELDMGASINNIIGFPFETRDMVFDTINMNRELWLHNNKLESNVFMFVPFKGCELYNLCKDSNLLPDTASPYLLSDRSILNFSEEFHNDLTGLIRTFTLYVKLPEEYHEKIAIAEQANHEGDRMLAELSGFLVNSAQYQIQ